MPGADVRARALHQRGSELMARGRPASAARLVQRGLRLLAANGSTGGNGSGPAAADAAALTARMLITLALTEVELGRPDSGFALLDRAEAMVAPGERGVLVQQRGLMLVLTGRMDDALRCLDEAVPLLSRSGDELVLARTLLNRGLLHHNAGRIGLARADLSRCERVARALGKQLLVAKATHNNGHCHLLAGDITGALRNFAAAADGYLAADVKPLLGMVGVDRARALLAAGLYTESATELDAAMPQLGRWCPARDRAEAMLTRAQVALAAGDWTGARRWAGRAERGFRRQGNHAWAAVAALARLQPNLHQRRSLAATAATADALAAELRGLCLDNDADAATLLAARAYGAIGRWQAARAAVGRCRTRTSLDNLVRRRLALAELSAADRDRAGVLRHSRVGLAALGRHQSRLGSVDLRTGSAALGTELAGLGLDTALAGGSPAQVFAWLERSRAQSFRARPVRPPADRRISDTVAELRHLAAEIRAAELAGHRDQAARRRCAELERTIRSHGWQVDGAGERRAEARLAAVRAELAAAGSALASFAVHRGRLFALVVTDRGARLCPLGGWRPVAESIVRLHGDLDALCDRVLPPQLDAVVRASAQRQSGLLAAELIAPLLPLVGDRDLVVVPTRSLSAVPWSALPPLRGRPVTVAPSASVWHDARRPAAAPGGAPTVLVTGPYLAHASTEVKTIAGIHADAVVLDGADATVAAVLGHLDGGAVVHIAAHGHHERDNVLFSRLDLADGPLMAYDLQQLHTAPAHVVLSACDIGRTVVRHGDELLGFTAALLYVGARTVVSSVNRAIDERAVDTMAAYHGALLTGQPPARALATACADDPLSPFVCFGAG